MQGNDTIQTVKNIGEWVVTNINWSDTPACKTKLTENECKTLLLGCGACGEKSELVAALLNSLNIPAVVTEAVSEDHAWNEVLINGQWILLDATSGKLFFNISKKEWEKHLKRNLSVVERYWANGTRIDVTKEYTDTSNITVCIIPPLENIDVRVGNLYLVENSERYKEPIYVRKCVTNESGCCQFVLGGNKYLFSVEKDGKQLFNCTFVIDENQNIILYLSNNSCKNIHSKNLFFEIPLFRSSA